MSIQDDITNSVELEDKSPLSTRLFTKTAILLSTLALLIFFVCALCYQIDNILGLNFFSAIFIPEIILSLIALYLAIAERLRAKYAGAIIAIFLSCLVIICVISFIIVEAARHGAVYLAPFNPPPTK